MEKTGTTSIQEMFSGQRNALKKAGLFYSRTLGRDNHVNLVVYARNDDTTDNQRKRALANTNLRLDKLREKIAQDLMHEAAENSGNVLLLSNEHLQSRLTTIEEKVRLRNLLLSVCPSISVYMYLRRQDLAATSLYGTRLLSGNPVPKERILPSVANGELPYFFDYRRIYREFCNVFGKAAVNVRVFEKERLVDGDVCADFLEWTGVGNTVSLEIPPPVNESISASAQVFMLQMNRLNPPFISGKPNPLRDKIVKRMRRIARGRGYRPSIEDARTFYEAFRADNRELFNEIGLSGFSEDFDSYSIDEDDQPVTHDSVAEIGVRLFMDVISEMNKISNKRER